MAKLNNTSVNGNLSVSGTTTLEDLLKVPSANISGKTTTNSLEVKNGITAGSLSSSEVSVTGNINLTGNLTGGGQLLMKQYG